MDGWHYGAYVFIFDSSFNWCMIIYDDMGVFKLNGCICTYWWWMDMENLRMNINCSLDKFISQTVDVRNERF